MLRDRNRSEADGELRRDDALEPSSWGGAPGKKTLTQTVARARLTRAHLDELLRLLPTLREALVEREVEAEEPREEVAPSSPGQPLSLIAHATDTFEAAREATGAIERLRF